MPPDCPPSSASATTEPGFRSGLYDYDAGPAAELTFTRSATCRGDAAVASIRYGRRRPALLPGWSALILQNGAEGAAADFEEYRIVFRVGQEHDREVQCPASGPRPPGVVDPDPGNLGAAGRLVRRPEAGLAAER